MSMPMSRVLSGLARPFAAAVLALVVAAPGTVSAVDPPPTDGPADKRGKGVAVTGDASSVQAERWIVQLRDPAVAKYTGGTAGIPATSAKATGREKLDAESSESQSYRAHLRSRQSAFKSELGRAAPRAQVDREYQVAFNGMAVKMSSADAAAVRKLPGVRSVTPDVPYTLQMYATPEQVGAPALWQQLGARPTLARA
jgi:hypothetical protein